MSSTAPMTLQPRQERTIMDVTSVEIGIEESVLHAEGKMGEYGKVYSTVRFKYNSDRSGGTFTDEGRGFLDENTMLSGTGMGIWRREGSKVILEELINVSDGTQNFHRSVWDARENKIVVDSYIIR